MSTCQMELTRDVWDLDDNQFCQMLEALQTEKVRREGVTTSSGITPGKFRGSREGVPNGKGNWVADRRGDGGILSSHIGQ